MKSGRKGIGFKTAQRIFIKILEIKTKKITYNFRVFSILISSRVQFIFYFEKPKRIEGTVIIKKICVQPLSHSWLFLLYFVAPANILFELRNSLLDARFVSDEIRIQRRSPATVFNFHRILSLRATLRVPSHMQKKYYCFILNDFDKIQCGSFQVRFFLDSSYPMNSFSRAELCDLGTKYDM